MTDNNTADVNHGTDAHVSYEGPEKAAYTHVSSKIRFTDYVAAVRCRTSNTFRMRYRVEPGLYALGSPDKNSPVLVTANYKLSLDALRQELTDRNAWILVIDTKGINVWCAAGKGTFCTKAIVQQIHACDLKTVVSHRQLILPQLGASGVASHKLQKESGFTVKFGPVRASDLPSYLDADNTATIEMRTCTFTFADRARLVPMEVMPAIKKLALFLLIAAVLSGITRTGILYSQALAGVLPMVVAGLTAVLTGSILTPLLLPFIPGRSFAVKGLLTGIPGAIAAAAAVPACRDNYFLLAFFLIAVPAFSSYLSFLFTGSSTYTSPSGVKAELRIAWPFYLCSAGISIILFVIVLIKHWGII